MRSRVPRDKGSARLMLVRGGLNPAGPVPVAEDLAERRSAGPSELEIPLLRLGRMSNSPYLHVRPAPPGPMLYP
jgi:hypothetical protein